MSDYSTRSGICSAICGSAEVQSVLTEYADVDKASLIAPEVASEAAQELFDYTARCGFSSSEEAMADWETGACVELSNNLPRRLTRPPNLQTILIWPNILAAIIAAVVQAFIKMWLTNGQQMQAAMRSDG